MSFGAPGAMAMSSGWASDPEARRKFLSALILVIFAAAIFYTASQVLPTAATVTSTSPSPAKMAAESAQPKAGTVVESPAKTIKPVATGDAVMPESSPETPRIVPAGSAMPVTDIKNAKKAPVVALAPRTAKPKMPKPPLNVRSGRYLLQLASLPSARDARRELTRLQNRLRPVLGKRKIAVIRAVPKGKRPVYRLRASAYRTRNSARAACDRVKKLKIVCLVVRR